MKPCEQKCEKCGSDRIESLHMMPGECAYSKRKNIGKFIHNDYAEIECISHQCMQCDFEWATATVATPGSCRDCVFWEYVSFIKNEAGTLDCGHCKRNAPVLIYGQGTCWPVTEEGNWCGQFEKRRSV